MSRIFGMPRQHVYFPVRLWRIRFFRPKKGDQMKKYLVFAMASILALSACGKKADNAKSDAKAEAAAEAPADAPI